MHVVLLYSNGACSVNKKIHTYAHIYTQTHIHTYIRTNLWVYTIECISRPIKVTDIQAVAQNV